MPLEEFADLIQRLGKYRFKNPEGIATAMSKAIRSSYRLGQVHQDSVDIVLSVLAKEIRSLEKLIKDLDKAIDDLVVVLPEYQCLTSIPVLIERFSDESKLVKYAGLYWRQNQSGKADFENTPMAKRGNRYLRYCLV